MIFEKIFKIIQMVVIMTIVKKCNNNDDIFGNMIRNVKHYPRLDTVLLVENVLRNTKESLNRTELYKKLGGRVMYSTLNVILAYLVDSGKIIMDGNRRLVWIYNPKAMLKFRKAKRLVLK